MITIHGRVYESRETFLLNGKTLDCRCGKPATHINWLTSKPVALCENDRGKPTEDNVQED